MALSAAAGGQTPLCYHRLSSAFWGDTVANSFHRFLPASFFLLLSFFAPGAAAQQNPPADFDSLSKAAAAARDSDRPGEAIPLYRRALDLKPDWAEGWWYLGVLLYDSDQFREAIPALQKVLALAPNAPGSQTFLGLCEFETADYDSALQHLESGFAHDSHTDPQLTRVTAYHLVLLLNRAGRFDRAAEILSSDLSRGAASEQITYAFGLTALHIPLLPAEVDRSKDALIQAVGRAALSCAQGQSAQAVAAFSGLLREYPDAPFLHSVYAAALQADGRSNEAATQLDLESKLHPQVSPADVKTLYANASPATAPVSGAPSADANWLRALQFFSDRRYADAIPALKATISQQPGFGTAWAMLGLSEFEQKDYENALLHLQKGNQLGLGGSPDSVRLARYRLALLLIHDGRFDEANPLLLPEAEGNSMAQQIQFALGLALLHRNLFPQDVPSADQSLVQAAGEISLLLHNSKYDAAFPRLQQLIHEHPNTPMLHYVYGVALSSFSRYDEALTQFAEESRITPQSALPYVQRAFVELQMRKPADALLSAQQAVQLSPRSAEAHYVLGRSLLDSGKYADAAKELETAVHINPGSPEVHFNLAKTYAKLNRPDDAARERAQFAQLNAEIEKQRSEHGSQAYGAAHTASELSHGAQAPPPAQVPPQK
jgi:tetratricopeptide (TPR) repeat protein